MSVFFALLWTKDIVWTIKECLSWCLQIINAHNENILQNTQFLCIELGNGILDIVNIFLPLDDDCHFCFQEPYGFFHWNVECCHPQIDLVTCQLNLFQLWVVCSNSCFHPTNSCWPCNEVVDAATNTWNVVLKKIIFSVTFREKIDFCSSIPVWLTKELHLLGTAIELTSKTLITNRK